jgi:hypothetical protein
VEPLMAALPKPSEFEMSHLYAKSLLEGTGDEIARKQKQLKAAAAALAAGAALGGALLWMRKQRQ